MKSAAPETGGSSLDPAISSEAQPDIKFTDMDRSWLRESKSMNAYATSDFFVPTIPQGIFCTRTVSQYQEEWVSRDRFQQFQKTDIGLEKASSRASQRSTGTGGAPKGPYSCGLCGKRYVQPQGVRRHYRAKHDPSSCLYCDFKWSRPYQYRAHIKKKHHDVISDLAPDVAKWARHRVANTAICMQQQPSSELVEVEVMPIHPSPMSHVD